MKKLLLLIILLLPTKLYGQALPCNPNNAYWIVTTTTATLKVCALDGLSWMN